MEATICLARMLYIDGKEMYGVWESVVSPMNVIVVSKDRRKVLLDKDVVLGAQD